MEYALDTIIMLDEMMLDEMLQYTVFQLSLCLIWTSRL